MPPLPPVLDVLAAAKRTNDAATVITLYCGHLEGLLAAQHAADPAASPEEWSADSYLAAKARERAEIIAEAINDDTVNQEITLLMDVHGMFQYLDLLMILRKHVDAGERGLTLDATIRDLYDQLCWVMEARALDESVPAAQIVRYLFAPSMRNADTYLRAGVQVRRECAVFDQRFTPPAERSPGWTPGAMHGTPPRTGSPSMKNFAPRAGSARRRSWRRRS